MGDDVKGIAILAISVIALTANGKESGSPQTSVEVKLAKAAVLEDLKDPESARLRNLFISNSPNLKGEMMQHLCGEINAKNAMGGYVGYRRFFADNESAMIDPGVDPGSDTMEGVKKTMFDDLYPRVCLNRTKEVKAR